MHLFLAVLLTLPVAALSPAAESRPGPGWHPSSPINLEPGVHYRSGTRLRVADYGTAFTIPQGWFGAMPPGSRTLYLESPKQIGLGLVSLLRGVTPEEMEEHLNEPQVIDEGYMLHPIGSATRTDQRITALYHHGQDRAVALALFGPDGTGILFMITGPQSEKPTYDAILDELARSVEFFAPQVRPAER